jgi:membrane protease YdiL (CAAX protease family)
VPPTVPPIHGLRALGITAMAVLATQGFQLLVAGSFLLVRRTDLAEAVARVSTHPLSLAVAQLLGFGAVLRMSVRWMARRGARPRLAMGLGAPPPLGTLALCLVAGLALQLPLAEIGNAVQELAPLSLETELRRQRLMEPTGVGRALVTLLAFTVVVPATEELLFRGLLLPGLEARHGTMNALLGSALLFGAIHFDWPGFASAAVAGLLLGAIRIRTGSLWPCLLAHAGVNAVPLLVPHSVWPIEGFNLPGEDVGHVPLTLLLPSLAIATIALALLERRTR